MKVQIRRFYTRHPDMQKKFYTPGKFGHIGKAIITLLNSGKDEIDYYYNRGNYLGVGITAKWHSKDLVRIKIGTSVRKYQIRFVNG